MRKRRLAVSKKQQTQASHRCYKQLNKNGLLLRHKHIAAYIADRGEIAPNIFFTLLWARKKTIYIPVLHPFQKHKMLFVRYGAGETLRANKFGILEPKLTLRNIAKVRFLGLVLSPLVAFDQECRRIGMGGGFYDRSFSFKRSNTSRLIPKLAGLAYEFQQVQHIDTQAWDVPLDAVVSECRTYLPRKNS